MRSKALALLVVSLLAAGCGGGSHPKAVASATPTASASPAPSPTPGLTGDPLTGLAPGKGPLVAIKVDNAQLAQPFQRGLEQAAIVYQELVEGGSTRFMAVFESSATKEVGPVRSARESDVDLLRGLGRPALGFSGANSGVFSIIRRAASRGYLFDGSRDAAPGLYRYGGSRRDANNYFVIPARLGAKVGGSQPQDIGWRFGPLPAGGVATAGASVRFAAASTMRVVYTAATGRWGISEPGHTVPAVPVNIVIQSVRTRASGFSDIHGMNTPYTVSTGSGAVVVLRDGMRFTGRWVRTGYGRTRLVDAAGNDLLLKPGPTWVMLLPQTGSASYG